MLTFLVMRKQEAEIFIEAPIESVFGFITDWQNTPLYERFITRIEPVEVPRRTDHQRWGLSHFRLLGLENKELYRYWSTPPHSYGAAQVEGILRGGFWFTLKEKDRGTHVIHGEFIKSRWKLLEWLVAFVFWRVLFPTDIQRQLNKLKELLERRVHSPARSEVKGRLARLAGHSLLD